MIEGSGDKAFCSGGYLGMPAAYQHLKNEHYNMHKIKTFQEYYS